jgi:hypothetical protein
VTAAIDGLHQLALANLTPPQADADKVLERYVAPDRRPLMRAYLAKMPAPFVAITTDVLAWSPVSYTDSIAVIRLATADTTTTATGEQKTSQAVTTVTLVWDGTQGWWRLATWTVGNVNVADVLAGGQAVPCHG